MRHRVGAADRVELVDDRSDVKLGRVDRDREPSRDGLVRRALSEQHEHLKFARGERNVDRAPWVSDAELCHHHRRAFWRLIVCTPYGIGADARPNWREMTASGNWRNGAAATT